MTPSQMIAYGTRAVLRDFSQHEQTPREFNALNLAIGMAETSHSTDYKKTHYFNTNPQYDIKKHLAFAFMLFIAVFVCRLFS